MDENEYFYEVKLKVKVAAFTPEDAWDALQDELAIGEIGAVTVMECEYKEKRRPRV